jgi:predicted transcriptional regulator of viral defense system
MVTRNIKKYKNIKKKYKTLGPEASVLLTELKRANKTVFTVLDAINILNTKKCNVIKLLKRLTDKGWFLRIEKGKYLSIPLEVSSGQPYTEHQFIIASLFIKPYYIGYMSMLNHYGYTEQLANTVFVASSKRKRDKTIAGVTYKFVYLPRYKMFGKTHLTIENNKILVSNREKTIIDCIDHPEYCGGIIEATKGLWNAKNDINLARLRKYVKKIKNSAVAKRLGYILERLKMGDKKTIDYLLKSKAKGYSLLDPLIPKKTNFNSRWNLILNIDESEMLSWKGT